MRKLVTTGRLAVLALLMLGLVALYVGTLYKLQIVDGEAAYEASTNSIVSYEPVAAARGSIMDATAGCWCPTETATTWSLMTRPCLRWR